MGSNSRIKAPLPYNNDLLLGHILFLLSLNVIKVLCIVLERSSHGTPLLIVIPYVYKEDYRPGHFEDYPSQRGFKFENGQLTQGNRPLADDLAVLASFLQEWLYFDLLEEFLRQPVEKQVFTR